MFKERNMLESYRTGEGSADTLEKTYKTLRWLSLRRGRGWGKFVSGERKLN